MAKAEDGTGLEMSPAVWREIEDILIQTSATSGVCLIIDYGADFSFSNTLRGIKGHKFVNDDTILKRPGEVDLSVNVNFADLAAITKHHTNCK